MYNYHSPTTCISTKGYYTLLNGVVKSKYLSKKKNDSNCKLYRLEQDLDIKWTCKKKKRKKYGRQNLGSKSYRSSMLEEMG